MNATVEISPIELVALKKLALINGALAKSLRDEGARREQTALLRVLMDVTARADLANHSKRVARKGASEPTPEKTGAGWDERHRAITRAE